MTGFKEKVLKQELFLQPKSEIHATGSDFWRPKKCYVSLISCGSMLYFSGMDKDVIEAAQGVVEAIDMCYVASEGLIDEVGFTYSGDGAVELFERTKLGIAHSIVKPTFAYAIARFHELRKEGVLSAGVDDEDGVAARLELVQVMRPILIVKGDMPSVLNVRKKLILDGTLDVTQELLFMDVIMALHPKSPSLWEHRRLLVKERVEMERMEGTIGPLLAHEICLCGRLCEKYQRNYYGWNHRLWLRQFMEGGDILAECFAIREWLKTHPSDHSACSYFHNLALDIIKLPQSDVLSLTLSKWREHQSRCGADQGPFSSTTLLFLLSMLSENESTIVTFYEYESPWYHRRSLWQLILQVAQPYLSASTPSTLTQDFSSMFRPGQRRDMDLEIPAGALPLTNNDSLALWIVHLLERETVFIDSVYVSEKKRDRSNADKFIEFVVAETFKCMRGETAYSYASHFATTNVAVMHPIRIPKQS